VTRTVRRIFTDNGDVVAMLTVVAAPVTMSTLRQARFMSKTHNVVQPDSPRARSVHVAQRPATVSTYRHHAEL